MKTLSERVYNMIKNKPKMGWGTDAIIESVMDGNLFSRSTEPQVTINSLANTLAAALELLEQEMTR